jgi:hypothetical protein
MAKKREVKVVYRRWTILIPIILITIGSIIMFGFWSVNAILGLFGGMIVLSGLLALGILLVMIISLELSSRSLQRQRPIPPPLSEDLEQAEKEKDTRTNQSD